MRAFGYILGMWRIGAAAYRRLTPARKLWSTLEHVRRHALVCHRSRPESRSYRVNASETMAASVVDRAYMAVILSAYHRATQDGRTRRAASQTGEKAVEDRDDMDGATQTTANGLVRLASVIAGLAREGAIDTRFGAKLFKRLDKEARRVSSPSGEPLDETEQSALFGALGELDVALRQRDAASLVEANARLRESESPPGKRRKGKKNGDA
jgi:hypothetical protein